MRPGLLLIVCLSFLLAACGAPAPTEEPALPFLVTTTDTPTPEEPQATPLAPEATATLESTLSAAESPTLEPAALAAAPTDTLLPPLELPTEKPSPPPLQTWTGVPTYPGDSEPGRLFRVDYDPDLWAQTEGNYGDVVLAHRGIDYCTITPWSGRGLPPDWKVEHEFREVGTVPYDVNTVSEGDQVKFVAYVGGDQRLLTGFQVAFQDQKDQCLQDAETVLASLRSFAAQPTITPTFTPEALTTPGPSATP